jgi:hypothetical protein
MSKDVGDITKQIYQLLSGLDAPTSTKILRAVSGLLDVVVNDNKDVTTTGGSGNGQSASSGGSTGDAKKFFADKAPNSKIEEFAVAAKLAGDTPLTKELAKAIISTQAKRRFDEAHFARDIDSAIRAGFFIKGARAEYVLSHYGEDYVDALPDRKAARAIKKPKKAGGKAKKQKKKAA